MKVFLDSSALAKRYIRENGSDRVDQILGEATSLGLSVLCLPEIVSALCRKHRETILNREQYLLAREALLADTNDAEVINLTPRVVGHAVILLEGNPLRAMDAFHIGSAIEWTADRFVSADKKQLEVAARSGLKTDPV